VGLLKALRRSLVLPALLLAGGGAAALETDQFYAWRRPLRDGADAINAWMRGQIAAAVADANRAGAASCEDVAQRIRRRMYFFVFQEVELWATQTPVLDRIPDGFDEALEYRKRYLFRTDNPFDLASWMPPSPTIEAGGVRFGTDKLSHFASVGWIYHRRYRDALAEGMDAEAAATLAIRFGVLSERTIFGASSTGALSIADLEANYQGMLFYEGLCNGGRPMLVRGTEGWTVARVFDLREHVTPEWDESWNPPIYRKRRWGRVRAILETHCADLDDPRVATRRAEYRARDRETPTERVVAALVREGRLDDPARFDIEVLCREGAP
jgi:hypothetical protein